ncbi:tetratricopeptide repeat protein [Candidatus Njordibacter sp. Uisw_058]|uniref:tetratricopeptide repeat protein n=1 Tax=Candidatus Njordibacter sp. Uisw_058 TaxID=3230974 RepID=UPI003D5892C0
MRIRKIIIGLTLSLLLGSGVAIAADFNKGREAAQSGDFKTALAEWTPLAEQGDIDAQYNLGVMYDNGDGVPENDKTAVKWYTKAAEQGHASAQFNLGSMYQNGDGVPENDKTAVKWYTKAAEQGHAKAQANLGLMYDNGRGVLTDTKRAYMWYNLSSYNDNEIGGKNKDKITKEMTPADISKAQDMSSLCLESNYTDC